MTATQLPDSLSPAVRDFLGRDHGLLIGGEWVPAADGRTFTTPDPSTGRDIAEVAWAGDEDVDRAVRAAHGALKGDWASTTPAQRSRVLSRLADLVEENADELAELEALDGGKPVRIAKLVDVARSAESIRYFSGWPTKITGEVVPQSIPNAMAYTRREPVGVCAQIIPWNFPLLMACWKIGPALATGCTSVLKPAEQTPLAALRLGELALEAGIPAGVVNILTGDGATGAALVRHPGVAKIAFTGSTEVGRQIAVQAAQDLKRVTLELGGKSANIVMPDADLDAATKGSFQAIYYNTGQACIAGSRLYVHKDHFDDVVSGIAARAGKARLGPGLSPDSQLGPVVSAEQYERVTGYIAAGRDEGAELVAGGGRGVETEEGWFVEPTIFAATDDTLRIAREEIFGPVLVAQPYDDVEDLARRANDTEYGLAAGIWTRDLTTAHRLAAALDAGSVYVNGYGMLDVAAPFGGFKASGIGREMGREGLDGYLETKTVWLNLA